jgi:hypothetical protein
LTKRKKLRLILSVIMLGLIVIPPSFADEQTIELSPEVPYVDVPVEATAPTQITIQTTTGTPSDAGFIDSWIELWQDATRIAFNDDGAHSGQNVLASYLSLYLDAGFYFIRATSYAYICCNSSPTGSYVLTWDGVTTVQTTPTPTPEPTPAETETQTPSPQPTIEPTEQPSPTPIATDSFTPTPEPTLTTQPEQILTQPEQNAPTTTVDIFPIMPAPTQSQTPNQEIQIIEETIEPETLVLPNPQIIEPEITPEMMQQQIDAQYIAKNTIELQLPTALEAIPGAAELFAAAEAIMNVGSDMTQEQREESQSVVVAAIIVTQIASMASVVSQNQAKKMRK